jgi:predicted lipoprotein with Yx(FWY)xxD motif
MTLYIRTSDPAGGSSCTGGCASAWPPLTVAAGMQPLAVTEVTGTLATFARSDGSLQVTYNGRALYYYAADTKPGDTSGQGVGGVWFVAPVSGSGATSPAPSAPASAPSAGASSSY